MNSVFKRAYWAAARLTFMLFAVLFGSWFFGMYLTAPLWSWYFFGSLKFWKYMRFFPGIFRTGYLITYMTLFHKDYVFVTRLRIDDPPRMQPDPDTIMLNPNWDKPVESCGDCHNCCMHVTCPLLNTESGLCYSYGSFYWKYFNCGRFPASKEHLEYFECAKWLMKE